MHQITINPHFTPHLLNIMTTTKATTTTKKNLTFIIIICMQFFSPFLPTHTHTCVTLVLNHDNRNKVDD